MEELTAHLARPAGVPGSSSWFLSWSKHRCASRLHSLIIENTRAECRFWSQFAFEQLSISTMTDGQSVTGVRLEVVAKAPTPEIAEEAMAEFIRVWA